MPVGTTISSGLNKIIRRFPKGITINGTSAYYLFYQCTGLLEVPLIDTSKITNFNGTFYACSSLTTIPQIDTSKGTNFDRFCIGCSSLTTVSQIDTSKGTNFSFAFSTCLKLTTVPLLDFSLANNIGSVFYNCSSLKNLGGLKDLGKAYSTTATTNSSNCILDLSKSTVLTHESLMNVINNLYDIASKGCNTQRLVLGSTNLAKLTEEEIAIATNKGWTVS